MAKLISYLTFNGCCREAMTFYHQCFGGELYLQTVGESPMAEELPQEMKACVLHSTLKKGGMVLMGTDMTDEEGIIRGNGLSILIDCQSEAEVHDFYYKLAVEGQKTQPIARTLGGALFGGVTDKFGNQWLLRFSLDG